jgi:arylformamidase
MRLYDVTQTLVRGMVTFPGEPGPELSPLKRIADGARANVSVLSLGLHTGTHVDAPRHSLDGRPGAEALPLDALCGPARVMRIEDPHAVGVCELERGGLEDVTRVLFQTRNGELLSQPEFRREFVYVAPEAAAWLVERGVRLVGVDYISIEAFQAGQPLTHRTLLGAGVVILEGLDLREVPPGDYEMWCLPLKIAGADGSPARVVLVKRGEEL